MSAAEVLVHELVHAVTVFAMSSRDGKIAHARDRLIRLHSEAMKVITVEDFMPDVSVDKEVEKQIAEAKWNYINKSLEEFMAYAMTNEKIMAKVATVKVYERKKPTGLASLIMYYLQKLADFAMMKWRKEKDSANGLDAVTNIVMAIAHAQDRAAQKSKQSWLSRLDDKIDDIDAFISDKLDQLEEKTAQSLLKTRPVKGSTLKARTIWGAKAIAMLLTHKQLQGTTEQLLTTLGMKPEGFVQMLLNSVKENDTFADIVEQLGLQSVQVDAHREQTAGNIAGVVHGLFKKELKRKQAAALQVVMQTHDGSLVFAKYGKDAVKYYTDSDERNKKVQELVDKLADVSTKEEMNFFKFQMDGLVELVTTGVGSEVQLQNAEAIAMLAGTILGKKKGKKEVVELIDEIVSLKAIEKIDEGTKKIFEELTSTELDGLVALGNMQVKTNEWVAERRTRKEQLNRRKGAVRETYDDYVTSVVAPIKDKKEMLAKGYKLEERLVTSKLDPTKEDMGLYVSRDMIRQPMNRSAVRFTGEKQHGRTIFENLLKEGWNEDITDVSKTARDAVKNGKKLTFALNDAVIVGNKVTLERLVVPELDDEGQIVEYRYMTSNTQKVKIGLELDAAEAVGRTWAHIVDEEETQKLNKVVWEELLLDMARNKGIGKFGATSGREYVKLKLDAKTPIMKEIMRLMPSEYRTKLKMVKNAAQVATSDMIDEDIAKAVAGDAWDRMTPIDKKRMRKQLVDGEVYVRRDMLVHVFGYRDLSAVDAPLVKMLPVMIKTFLRKLENLWKEFVGLYKVDVVIKTLPVLIGNIVGNVMSIVLMGGSLKGAINDSLKAWKELDIYKEAVDRLVVLKAEMVSSGNKELQKEIDRLELALNELEIKPLLDAGFYTQIIEEADMKNFKNSNRIASWIDDKVEGWPEVIKTGGNFLYSTQRSGPFQLAQKITAKSDFMARYAQWQATRPKKYRLMEKKLGRELTVEEKKKIDDKVLIEIRDAFINYAKPDSAILQYMNDMGLVLFTKYAVRIQRIAKNMVTGHPTRALLAMIGQEVMSDTLGWEPEDVLEKSIIFGDKNLLFMPEFTDMLESLVVPQMYTSLHEGLKV